MRTRCPVASEVSGEAVGCAGDGANRSIPPGQGQRACIPYDVLTMYSLPTPVHLRTYSYALNQPATCSHPSPSTALHPLTPPGAASFSLLKH